MNYYQNELYHHGIKGQKWGIRRFQNRDGTLTSAGRKHRSENDDKQSNSSSEKKIRGLSKGQKTALKIGAAVAVAGLAAYGGYKLNQKTTKSLIDSYSAVGKTFLDFSRRSHELSFDALISEESSKNAGNLFEADKHHYRAYKYEKRGNATKAESDRLHAKAKNKQFSKKERWNTSKNILLKGYGGAMSSNIARISKESHARINDQND